MAAPTSVVDTVVSLCKRRGFVFPCGEIYGGTRSAWDYGPLGVELKENIKRQWWRSMVTAREDVVGLDSSIILPRQTWVASGHVGEFTDPLTECQSCHKRFRVDHMQEAVADREAKKGKEVDPDSIAAGRHRLPQLRHPRPVDRAAQLQHDAQDLPRRHRGRVGPALPAPRDRPGHLRQLPQRQPGLAQEAAVRHRPDRQELPQRDHPGQLHLPHPRVRADGDGVLRQARRRRAVAPVLDRRAHRAGTPTSASTPRTCAIYEHPAEKLSHYSKRTVDIEYRFNFTGSEWGELEGIANRTDFDLTTHIEALGHRPGLLRPGQRREVHALRHRAGGRASRAA